jgi:hypothetical protein
MSEKGIAELPDDELLETFVMAVGDWTCDIASEVLNERKDRLEEEVLRRLADRGELAKALRRALRNANGAHNEICDNPACEIHAVITALWEVLAKGAER